MACANRGWSGDLFDMQNEIVARLANQLDTQLIAAEAIVRLRFRPLIGLRF